MKVCTNGTFVNTATGWCNSSLVLLVAAFAIVFTIAIISLLPEERF